METEFDSRDYVLTNKFLEDFVLKVYHLQILVSIIYPRTFLPPKMFCICAVLLIQVKMRKSEKHNLLRLWVFFLLNI